MTIMLNGDRFDLGGPTTIAALLSQLSIDPRRVAVEHNLIVVKREAYASTVLAEGDDVEIINFVGGGEQHDSALAGECRAPRWRAQRLLLKAFAIMAAMLSVKRSSCMLMVMAALAAAGCGRTPERVGTKNAILIVIDTLRADHLGAYGYGRNTTPNIDRLAARGVRFETALAHSSWSPPSHTSIITSRYPSTHRMDNWGTVLAPEIRSLPEILHNAGFTTALFSEHLGLKVGTEGLFRGLDYHEEFLPEREVPLTNAITAWLRKFGKRQERFFMWAIYTTPHAPYNAPAAFNAKFSSKPDPKEKRFPFVADMWLGAGGIPASVRNGDEQRASFYTDRYDGDVAYNDAMIGRVLKTLADLQIEKDTLVALTADHGEGLGEHGVFAHGQFLYENLIQVPLIFSPLSLQHDQRVVKAPAQLVDVVPTLLEFLGVETRDRLEGVSLRPWIFGLEKPRRRLAYGSFRDQGFRRYYVRSQRWKLIWNDDQGKLEVYDLSTDPQELNNLATNTPKLPPEVVQMTRRLRNDATSYDRTARSVGKPLSPEAVEALKSLGYVK